MSASDTWKNYDHLAQHWAPVPGSGDKVQCSLCPRHCTTRPGQTGFCGVRGNREGSFYAYSYGRSVNPAVEMIETEAVYHYRPGAAILSMGNVGCMMACSYCQNWETSQVKHLDPGNVKSFTPKDVIDLALSSGAEIISWTYNDPVVWHEFVMDTSALARRHGLRTLYKSALYIELQPLRELLEVIDIFSISLKSMSPEFYRKHTGGARLEPVLAGIELIAQHDVHLELSQLLVTDLNEREEDVRKTIRWVLDHVGPAVPLHFVRFHPAYKYTEVDRTPIPALRRARELAFEAGVHHCYIGNVYEEGVADTLCRGCRSRLVRRFGMTITVEGLDEDGRCRSCRTPSTVIEPHFAMRHVAPAAPEREAHQVEEYVWDAEVNSLHLVTHASAAATVTVERLPSGDRTPVRLGGGLQRRILSRGSEGERGVRLHWSGDAPLSLYPVLDRAHYPTMATDACRPAADPGLVAASSLVRRAQ